MSCIVAAVDGRESSGQVLQAAVALGDLLHVKVHAFHVEAAGSDEEARRLASRYLLPLERAVGEPGAELARRLDAPDVVMGVVGRGGMGLSVAAITHRPIVVVPGDGHDGRGGLDHVSVVDRPLVDPYGAVRDTAEMLRRAGATVSLHSGDVSDPAADLIVMGRDHDEQSLRETVGSVPVPVLLVPLPSFTQGFEPAH